MSQDQNDGCWRGAYWNEAFTDSEKDVLRPYFTQVEGPVTVLTNLPEIVKSALFARYSRSPKSIRRLFLDEFVANPDMGIQAIASASSPLDVVDTQRATKLYDKIFAGYGDDSVAQLGGVHIACEQASNLLTKVLEWGRLASYLEQSTRYIFFDSKLGGRYRYHIPPELYFGIHAGLRHDYVRVLDNLFETYRALVPRLAAYYEARHPRAESDSPLVYASTIRARVCDDLRGLLPAATISNLGIYANGQALEAFLIRMRAHPLEEAGAYADLIHKEVEKVVPSFVQRVNREDRGGRWSKYLEDTAAKMRRLAEYLPKPTDEFQPDVVLTEWDPDAEEKVAAACLYAYSDLPDDVLLSVVQHMSYEDRADILKSYVGDRENRRHKPGRAFERATYRFDVLGDYGLFRDLQRHRMLTVEWQKLSPRHGYDVPVAIQEIGAAPLWNRAMDEAIDLHGRLSDLFGADVAQYVVPFAFKIRFYLHMNAREAFHLLELRTAAQGHPSYRKLCQEMHTQIRDKAGHGVIADAMKFVDHNRYDLGRLGAERRSQERATALNTSTNANSAPLTIDQKVRAIIDADGPTRRLFDRVFLDALGGKDPEEATDEEIERAKAHAMQHIEQQQGTKK